MASRLALKSAAIVTAAFAGFLVSGGGFAGTANAAVSRDADHDGMPDSWERANRLNVHRNDSRVDLDRDGLTNLGEYLAGTSPRRPDTDRDGIKDGAEDPDGDGLTNQQELTTRTGLRNADTDRDGIKDGAEDADGDHLTNQQEFRVGDNPLRRDSDGDGVGDGAEDNDGDGLTNEDEFKLHMDPTDGDSDDDGKPDGEERAGVISVFDPVTGVLTIALDAVSQDVTVTGTTELEWEGHGSTGTQCTVPPTTSDLVVGTAVHEVETVEGDTSPAPVADSVKLICP